MSLFSHPAKGSNRVKENFFSPLQNAINFNPVEDIYTKIMGFGPVGHESVLYLFSQFYILPSNLILAITTEYLASQMLSELVLTS